MQGNVALVLATSFIVFSLHSCVNGSSSIVTSAPPTTNATSPPNATSTPNGTSTTPDATPTPTKVTTSAPPPISVTTTVPTATLLSSISGSTSTPTPILPTSPVTSPLPTSAASPLSTSTNLTSYGTISASPSSTLSVSSTMTVTTSPPTRATPTTTSGQEFWDKVIMDYLGGTLITFIVLVSVVGLCLILLIAFICVCHQYRKLKKKTRFPKDLIINNDSAWINSNDNLLMWERNLRATEVNPNNAVSRPPNEKRP